MTHQRQGTNLGLTVPVHLFRSTTPFPRSVHLHTYTHDFRPHLHDLILSLSTVSTKQGPDRLLESFYFFSPSLLFSSPPLSRLLTSFSFLVSVPLEEVGRRVGGQVGSDRESSTKTRTTEARTLGRVTTQTLTTRTLLEPLT